MSQEQSLEDRVAYLEQNIRVLNKATTRSAKAMNALLAAVQTNSSELSAKLEAVLGDVCPFPPGCEEE